MRVCVHARGQGADLAFVFCEPSAATAIKSYSPEVIVIPYARRRLLAGRCAGLLADPRSTRTSCHRRTTDAADVQSYFSRLHVLVVGPGLGRDPAVQARVTETLREACKAQLPLIIDGVRRCRVPHLDPVPSSLTSADARLCPGRPGARREEPRHPARQPARHPDPERERVWSPLQSPGPWFNGSTRAGQRGRVNAGVRAGLATETGNLRLCCVQKVHEADGANPAVAARELAIALGNPTIVRKGAHDIITDGGPGTAGADSFALSPRPYPAPSPHPPPRCLTRPAA